MTTHIINIKIDEDKKNQLKELAKDLGLCLSTFSRMILLNEIKEKDDDTTTNTTD